MRERSKRYTMSKCYRMKRSGSESMGMSISLISVSLTIDPLWSHRFTMLLLIADNIFKNHIFIVWIYSESTKQ
jgi:hypothetical protein